MKLAIISDVHDNLVNLQKAIKYCEQVGIKVIIGCGDYGGEEVLAELAKYQGEFYGCLGNMDRFKSYFSDLTKRFNNLTIWPEMGEKIFDNLNIAFTHYPEEAEFLVHPSEDFPKAEYSFIFYGHTHQPWEKTIDGVRLVNPGNLAGQFYLATFAVLDTDTKQLDLVMVDQLK